MAQLSSPGVSVSVIDESFYTPAAPGTVPLIIVASEENKANSAGTGIAPGTLKANAGKAYLLTSQLDLGSTFGIPYFQTDANNNPVHAGELNEYGLQAAYSFLGVANRAYVVRADIDTSQLIASTSAPAGKPADGAIWLDTVSTKYGIFEWNGADASVSGGQTFINKIPTVLTDVTKVGMDGSPKGSVGAIGDYAIVATTNLYTTWYKNYAGLWVEVGSEEWITSVPTIVSGSGSYVVSGETVVINNTTVHNGGTTQASMASSINAAFTDHSVMAVAVSGRLYIFSDAAITIGSTGTGLAHSGLTVGTFYPPALTIAAHTMPPQYKASAATPRPTGSIWIKTTTPNQGASYSVKTYNANTGTWVEAIAPLYATASAALAGMDPTGGGSHLSAGRTYVQYDTSATNIADFKVFVRKSGTQTSVSSASFKDGSGGINGTISFNIQASVAGSATLSTAEHIVLAVSNSMDDAEQLANLINQANIPNVIASVNNPTTATAQVVVTHVLGGEITFVDVSTPTVTVNSLFGASSNWAQTTDGYVASLWSPTIVVTASASAPTSEPADGQLWYKNVVDEVDILVHNGHTWVGYLFNANSATGKYNSPYYNANPDMQTDPMGPQVAALAPKTQSDGSDLVAGDLWISTANMEEFPMINRWDGSGWVLLDNTDQTTENGVLFHDARWNTSGLVGDESSITDLLASDFLDFDAPDPALYPQGMILWNLRRSGNNVLRYVRGYVDQMANNVRYFNEPMTNYVANKWVSDAPNDEKGAGQFGRKAQRAVVLKALNSLINENQDIRDEDSRVFNLMSCPGYLETLPALNALNADRGLLSFVVADSPARLTPDATSLSDWGNNVNGATGDGETGLISTDANSAVYYPWAMTTDLLGNEIVVPPSHIMLRTIALSDNVSFPWFAPAGTRRGGVNNASAVGYVDPVTGEFNTVALNTGQRDTLAAIHVNPITYIGGVGLVAYGQKTRQLTASAMDRINVARLVIYLRYQLNQIAKPYIFEPNDTITRNEIKQQIETMLLEITGQRGLYDYLVVCDTSNNTPARIDRNELHVDIAIEPVKAVEFIYIPLRLENTGAIKGLGQ